MIAPYIPFVVALVLITATVIDLRTGRIPNALSYAFIGLFAVLVVVSPDKSPFIWQLLFAVVTFAVGIALYALLGFGAGAVKLLAGAALFMPVGRPMAILGILLAALFLMGLVVTLARKWFGHEDSKWKVLSARLMPLSLPVTVTSLLAMFWLQA
jgi:prepilin peptidase CpaA